LKGGGDGDDDDDDTQSSQSFYPLVKFALTKKLELKIQKI
jgi:hypothetical protein